MPFWTSGTIALTGPLPARIGEALALSDLRLPGNPLKGFLPESMTHLMLQRFNYQGTELCAPRRADFQRWLTSGLEAARIPVESGAGAVPLGDAAFSARFRSGA